MKTLLACAGLLSCCVLAVRPVAAAPILPAATMGTSSWAGTSGDPHAARGQWFVNPADDNRISPRSHQFHDNASFGGEPAGAGSRGSDAILGIITDVTLSGANIVGFQITATITNDAPSTSPWAPGANSHGEQRSAAQLTGILADTLLTANFALADLGLPVPAGSAYRETGPPYIVAANETHRAWYCWSPLRPAGVAPGQSDGGYYVPAWDFGTIAPGQSVTRTLDFLVTGAGIAPTDPRYGVMIREGTPDLLFSRSTSFKIGEWLGDLKIDEDLYPETGYGANVSVFANLVPEPASLILLAVGSGLLRRRAHPAWRVE